MSSPGAPVARSVNTGFIDSCKAGVLKGWASGGGADEAVTIRVDGVEITRCHANLFRPDLFKVGISDGFAAFAAPLPPHLLDGKEHFVETLDVDGLVISKGMIALKAPESFATLSNTVIYKRVNRAPMGATRVALLCGYEKNTAISSNTSNMIRLLKDAGFYVVLILAVDHHTGPRPRTIDEPDTVILRTNIGYDFGSWGLGLLHLRELGLADLSQVLLLNDSLLWTGSPLDLAVFKPPVAAQADVLGVTGSYERGWHLQSYCLSFGPAVLRQHHLDEFLLYNNPVPREREDAIARYELLTASFFTQRGFSVAASIDYGTIQKAVRQEIGTYLAAQAHRDDWLHGRDSIESRCQTWANRLQLCETFNPTHLGWRQLLGAGFPFIKKELVAKNPARVPFHHETGQVFTDEARPAAQDYLKSAAGFYHPIAG